MNKYILPILSLFLFNLSEARPGIVRKYPAVKIKRVIIRKPAYAKHIVYRYLALRKPNFFKTVIIQRAKNPAIIRKIYVGPRIYRNKHMNFGFSFRV